MMFRQIKNFLFKNLARTKERVLFANNIPAFSINIQLDYALAQELKSRGCEVAISLCDGLLDACLNCKYSQLKSPEELVTEQWKDNPLTCNRCKTNTNGIVEDLNDTYFLSDFNDEIRVQKFAQEISSLTTIELKNIVIDGVIIYEHAFSGTARFFAKGQPQDEDTYEQILRKFILAAFRTLVVYERIFEKFSPTVIICHHGIYVPQGIIIDLAKKNNIRIVTYNTGYRTGTFVFAHGDTYHKILPKESIGESKYTFSANKKNIIKAYLESRRTGKNDWIYYNKHSKNAIDIRKEYSIKESKKVISVFTNVYWDAQLHFPENIYPDMMLWLLDTIDFIKDLTKVHCIIRAHPAEVSGFVPSRQNVVEEIKKLIKIPNNVTLISSDYIIDSYQVAEQSDLIITYATKMAGELAALGKNVIVCGDAWAKGKGFTFDPITPAEYRSLISILINKNSTLEADKRNAALRYCYDFFFNRSIELEFARQDKSTNKIIIKRPNNFNITKNDEKYPGLNAICNGIIYGKDFRSTNEV